MMPLEKAEIPGGILIRGAPLRVVNCPEGGLERIVKSFEISEINSLQKRIISAIRAEQDVFIVGPENSGKTIGYLIPVLGLLRCINVMYKGIRAPSVLFVCPSTTSGIKLLKLIKASVDSIASLKHLIVFLFDDMRDHTALKKLQTTGADILIISGAVLNELLKNDRMYWKVLVKVNFERLKFAIFEEIGMKAFYFAEDIVDFLNCLNILPTHSSSKKLNARLIFCGSVWNSFTSHTEKCISGVRNPVIILGSAENALQYSRISWKLHDVSDENSRLNTILDVCQSLAADHKRTVVCCGTNDAAKAVSRLLWKNDISNTLEYREEGCSGVFGRKHEFMKLTYVIADSALDVVHIENVACVVHFDLSDLPETPFCSKRFTYIWHKLEREGDPNYKSTQETHLILSGHEKNIHCLDKFLSSMEVSLPPRIKNLAEAVWRKEILKMPLCPNIKCFSICNQHLISQCSYRHEISQADIDQAPMGLNNGEVEFIVEDCANPSLYKVRLRKHFIFVDNRRVLIHSFEDDFRNRISQMIRYYSKETNRVIPKQILPGDVYCSQTIGINFKSTVAEYVRVRIENVYFEKNKGASAKVYCIDYGVTEIINCNELLDLPSEFKTWSAHNYQVVLSNLLPTRGCSEYQLNCVNAARDLAKRHVWTGKILLALGNTIWINPMVQYEKDPVTGHTVKGQNLRCELVRMEYAECIDSSRHMHRILDLVRKIDPEYPSIPTENETEVLIVGETRDEEREISWVSLPISEIKPEVKVDLAPFKIYSWSHPWEIYGVPFIAESLEISPVISLELEMTEDIERIFQSPSLKHFMKSFTIGEMVAIKGTNRRWRRGMVLEIVDEEELDKFSVLCVDYGTTMTLIPPSEIISLPEKYKDMLDFQAVCLKLASVQPLKNDIWTNSEINNFLEILNPHAINRPVDVVAISEVLDSEHPCHYYEAFILLPEINKASLLNYEELGNCLVKRGSGRSRNSSGYDHIIKSLEGAIRESDSIDQNSVECGTSSELSPMEENDNDGDVVKKTNELHWQSFLDEGNTTEDDELPGPSLKELQLDQKLYTDRNAGKLNTGDYCSSLEDIGTRLNGCNLNESAPFDLTSDLESGSSDYEDPEDIFEGLTEDDFTTFYDACDDPNIISNG